MIVIDTNILAYHWLPSPKAILTESLARLDSQWAAPLLWRSEFRNVLAGYMRLRGLSTEDAKRTIRHAASSLLAGEHAIADELVLALLARSPCSAYDCEFVTLAETLNVLLVTDDKALLSAFPKRCRSLEDSVKSGLKR